MKKLVGILTLASMPFIVNANAGFITGFAAGTILKQDNSYAQSEKFLNVGNGVYIPINSIIKVKITSEKNFSLIQIVIFSWQGLLQDLELMMFMI